MVPDFAVMYVVTAPQDHIAADGHERLYYIALKK